MVDQKGGSNFMEGLGSDLNANSTAKNMSMKFGPEISVIRPDESIGFLTPAEKSELFSKRPTI